MLNKKLMMLVIFLVSLLAVSMVNAAENTTEDIASINDATDAVAVDENDDVKLDDDALSSVEEDKVISIDDEENVLDASPPYNKYSVSVSDTTITYGSGGNVKISVTPVNGYDYKYDFYFRVYDSNGNQKISKNYYSTSSTYTITHSIGANELSVGTYTIKLINYADSKVMDTAMLTVKSSSSSSTYPSYSAYSVSVSDTTINYGSSGSISMSISPASGYTYKYYYYLKVYDSSNNEKISQSYYGTSSAYSKKYSVSSNQLSAGSYTIKIINYYDSKVMDTAKLTVKSPTYFSAYSVSVSDTSMTYGETSGSIMMSISPASTSNYIYAYDFNLKVYDSYNNQKISQRYYSTSSSYSQTYNIGSTSLSPGVYTIKIINNADNNVMSTAKLTVKKRIIETQNVTGYCDGDIQFKARISDNYDYKEGLSVTFICNNNEYSAVTDNDGYATLNIHLKSGDYQITTKCGQTYKYNDIIVKKRYVADKYRNVKIKAPNAYYKQKNKKITYSFEGNLNGYFKIYKGKSLKYSKKINTNGYIDDYFKYNKHSYSYAINKIKNVGKYSVKIVNSKGKVLAKSTFKIKKSPTKTRCYSFKIKVGSKKSIKAYIYDKSSSRKNVGGTAKFKINGKTYKVKVKKGVAVVKKVKFSYKVKTYKCSVKYYGDKNHKASSAKFKINARKLGSIVVCFPPTVKTSSKHTLYVYAAIKNLDGEYSLAKSGVVKLKIAGKTYKAKVKNGEAKVKIKAPSHAKTYKCKVSYSCGKTIKTSSSKFNLVVKKPASKYKVITTHAKSYWITKYSGAFAVQTKIWDMTAGMRAPYKYIDTTLYKNGKQVYPTKYSVKYKINGRWTGWLKDGTSSTAHHRYSVLDSASVGQIKVKVHKNVNSYI